MTDPIPADHLSETAEAAAEMGEAMLAALPSEVDMLALAIASVGTLKMAAGAMDVDMLALFEQIADADLLAIVSSN